MIGIESGIPFCNSSHVSIFPTIKISTSPNVTRLLISSLDKLGKNGTETYPAIRIAKSAIIHSRQFFEINPICAFSLKPKDFRPVANFRAICPTSPQV